MKKVFFKITGVNLLLCFLSFQTQAQDKSQIRFSVSPILYDNLTLSHEGEKLLNASPTLSAETYLSYHQPIYKDYAINLGVGITLPAFNTNYNFEAPDNSIFQTGEYSNGYKKLLGNDYWYESTMYIFPISLNKIFSSRNSDIIYSLDIGIKLNKCNTNWGLKSRDYYYISEQDPYVTLLNLNLETGEKENILSYFIKVGLIKGNKIGDSFHVNLVANYSPKLIASGSYEFFNLGYESSGSIEQNINYIGIEFSYGLSLNNKKHSK